MIGWLASWLKTSGCCEIVSHWLNYNKYKCSRHIYAFNSHLNHPKKLICFHFIHRFFWTGSQSTILHRELDSRWRFVYALKMNSYFGTFFRSKLKRSLCDIVSIFRRKKPVSEIQSVSHSYGTHRHRYKININKSLWNFSHQKCVNIDWHCSMIGTVPEQINMVNKEQQQQQ